MCQKQQSINQSTWWFHGIQGLSTRIEPPSRNVPPFFVKQDLSTYQFLSFSLISSGSTKKSYETNGICWKTSGSIRVVSLVLLEETLHKKRWDCMIYSFFVEISVVQNFSQVEIDNTCSVSCYRLFGYWWKFVDGCNELRRELPTPNALNSEILMTWFCKKFEEKFKDSSNHLSCPAETVANESVWNPIQNGTIHVSSSLENGFSAP